MIPKKIKDKILEDPYYKSCCREDEGDCGGRITWEHALTYKNRQVQEVWAIIPLCERHHSLGKWHSKSLNKRRNVEIALSRATEEDLKKYPKQTWKT